MAIFQTLLFIVNKSTKIWLNYIAGGIISLFLLWNIYHQVSKQVSTLGKAALESSGNYTLLGVCICLMFANTSLEGFRWYVLTNTVEPTRYYRAFCSYLAGIAFSIITPNRIGEYPARILYLGRNHTFKYINVSALSIMAQLSAVYFFGFIGLLYYNFAFPALWARMALAACGLINIFTVIAFFRFESWLPLLMKFAWLRKYVIYARLINRFTGNKLLLVMGISFLRFIIFTLQFVCLLWFMKINQSLPQLFCLSALFFWLMAVIPSIALTELGMRGTAGLFLFSPFTANPASILVATTGIWMLNLIIPSIIGSILILRMRLLR